LGIGMSVDHGYALAEWPRPPHGRSDRFSLMQGNGDLIVGS
jgi:hypothetical protein